MAQAQPLKIPTMSKLTEARELLCEAVILVSDVKSLLSDSCNCAMAARLNDIQGRLADEIWAVERLIAAGKPRTYHLTQRDHAPLASRPNRQACSRSCVVFAAVEKVLVNLQQK